jgi:adenylate cyclase class IV
MKNIEVELRAKFDKATYDRLLDFLTKNATDLGADDKRVWFFVMPDKLLKVTHNVTKKNGKITLKLTKIGQGSSFEEIEFPIAESDIEKAVQIFTTIGHDYLVEPEILRHDFSYKGVELALKYSKTWDYHLELEVLVSAKEEEREAEAKIRSVADELGIEVMTEAELQKFTANIEATYVNPKL